MGKTYTASQIDYYIFTGEISGDDRGFELISELKKQQPLATFHGVPGPKLRTLGVRYVTKMESFQVMGFIDVVKSLPLLYRLFHRVKDEILYLNPKVVILIDYPGFTLKLAKALKKAGYTGKVVQYVCPTVWAWKKNRISTMEKYLDLLLTLLPFEPPLFNQEKLRTAYVGHPLVHEKQVEGSCDWTPPYKAPYLALFPGSRETEIAKNLPLQLAVAQETRLPIVISCSHEKFIPLLTKISREEAPLIAPQHTHALLASCSYAIATSGTICLQLALHNVPSVCTYAIRPFDEFLATKIFKINLPYYCIVNILAEKEIFPEYFGSNLSYESLTEGLQKVINGSHACDTLSIAAILGERHAAEEASKQILSLSTI